MDTKKFLDQNGVSHLWGKIKDNFLNADNVKYIVDVIDEEKADKESPAFTGTPTAPTADITTNSTQIATTEFVQSLVSSISSSSGPVEGTAYILISMTSAVEDITCIATNVSSKNQYTGTINSDGLATIPVNEVGVFSLKYNSDGIITSPETVNVNSFNETYTVSISYTSAKKVYTAAVDLSNSNPDKCVSYLDDAENMRAAADNWDDMPIFKDIHPCVFKDGEVVYYLDRDNFNLKENGDEANLDGTDGDVMIEFPKFAYKIYKDTDNNILYVSVTNDEDYATENDYKYYAFSKSAEGDKDHFYYGAFEGSLDSLGNLQSVAGQNIVRSISLTNFKQLANNKGEGYTISSFYQLVAIQCLYLIKYGNTNGQNALGNGMCNSAGTSATGETITFKAGRGMDYGSTSYFGSGNWAESRLGHVKLFGIEDIWASYFEFIDNVKLQDGKFVITQSWQDNTEITSDNSFPGEGYISDVIGDNDFGFMPLSTSGGSYTTYFCDYFRNGSTNCILFYGGTGAGSGSSTGGQIGGPFCCWMDQNASYSASDITARLMYL